MAKFKTSARTVDMLGRQQIAGIPTAMSELFKNAYDAYATIVRADYFPSRSLLLLRDDGLGMSEQDFLNRWLTLGTDSKAAGGSMPGTVKPPGMKPRQQMGEKGIGRLAIASIAPIVLVVTRSNQAADDSECITGALVPWRIFETPGLTLDEIEIAVDTFGTEDSLTAIRNQLAETALESVERLRPRMGEAQTNSIRLQIDACRSLDLDPLRKLDGPQVHRQPGTAFILFTTGEDLSAAVAEKPDNDAIPEFQRFLGGFTNSITNNPDDTPIATRFIVHEDGAVERDLIGPDSFWRMSDFKSMDHTIAGEFDDEGTFVGSVELYGGKSIPYTIGWGNPNRAPRCGAFKFKLGVLQGDVKESRLPTDEYVLMAARLRAQGGLYVYRDGIRVLPYGNSDVDYLEIEKRRTLNAGRYFFSHRRIFGAIELSSTTNPSLQEKAGREGFRQNVAYRDFVDILQHFLQQVAADFFRAGGEHGDDFVSQKSRIENRARARLEKEKRERVARDRFAEKVEMATNYLTSDAFPRDVAIAEEDLEKKLRGSEGDTLTHSILLSETVRALERKVRSKFEIDRPVGLALTSSQARDFEALRALAVDARRHVSGALSQQRQRLLNSIEEADLIPAVEPTVAQVVSDLATDATNRILAERAAAAADLDLLLERIAQELAELTERSKNEIASIAALAVSIKTREDNLDSLSQKIDDSAERAHQQVRAIRSTVEQVFFDPALILDNRDLQERVLDLEEEVDANVELMQLGLAVQLVNHEMENSIETVRDGLRRLQPWAKANQRLAVISDDIRIAFQHLDGYLRLFTPLQRRLYRQRVNLTGNDLLRYALGVFDERLRRHEISLTCSKSFLNFEAFGYPSNFYPAILNVVDNAIYWTQQSQNERRIYLDSTSVGMSISDSGPGISSADRDAIFERGFSRRRGGRGLGLALSSQILDREGWSLTVAESVSALGGATFLISKTEGEDDDD